jgi:hypothetical protein
VQETDLLLDARSRDGMTVELQCRFASVLNTSSPLPRFHITNNHVHVYFLFLILMIVFFFFACIRSFQWQLVIEADSIFDLYSYFMEDYPLAFEKIAKGN